MLDTDRAERTAPEGVEGEVASLYQQHANSLLRYAQARADSVETAREALQEAFLRYFIECSYGRQIHDARAWLFEVVRNYLLDRGRSLAARREVVGEGMERVPDVSPDPEALAEGRQMARDLQASLSAREMECLRLRTEGLSYVEIGAAMKLRTGTVGALLARAYEKIRKQAEEGGRGGRAVAAALSCLMRERTPCPG